MAFRKVSNNDMYELEQALQKELNDIRETSDFLEILFKDKINNQFFHDKDFQEPFNKEVNDMRTKIYALDQQRWKNAKEFKECLKTTLA